MESSRVEEILEKKEKRQSQTQANLEFVMSYLSPGCTMMSAIIDSRWSLA